MIHDLKCEYRGNKISVQLLSQYSVVKVNDTWVKSVINSKLKLLINDIKNVIDIKHNRGKSMKLNNKGITLLEVLVAGVILGMLCMFSIPMIKIMVKLTKRAENASVQLASQSVAVPVTTSALDQVKTTWRWVYVPNLNECKPADAQYWIKRTANRVITLYKDAQCTQSFGTLNALDNSRYANDTTKTLWEVSGDTATLRVLLIIFP